MARLRWAARQVWSQICKERGRPAFALLRDKSLLDARLRAGRAGRGYAKMRGGKDEAGQWFGGLRLKGCRGPSPRAHKRGQNPIVNPPQGDVFWCFGGESVKKKTAAPVPSNVEFCQTRHAAVKLSERLAGQVCEASSTSLFLF